MKYYFKATLVIIKHMFRHFIYQVILLNSNFINNILILFIFLWFKCCHIGAKSRLLKNISIDVFDIFLICIDFAYA